MLTGGLSVILNQYVYMLVLGTIRGVGKPRDAIKGTMLPPPYVYCPYDFCSTFSSSNIYILRRFLLVDLTLLPQSVSFIRNQCRQSLIHLVHRSGTICHNVDLVQHSIHRIPFVPCGQCNPTESRLRR